LEPIEKNSSQYARPVDEDPAGGCGCLYWQFLPTPLSLQEQRVDPMPTRNISLTPEQDAFIDEMLKTGEYHNASEAVRDAIRALQQRRALDALKLERLRQCIDAGIADLDNGNYEDVDEADLEAWLDRLDEPARS
jgi:antitoxin ParD1/3/4